jgi:hypothetical protein
VVEVPELQVRFNWWRPKASFRWVAEEDASGGTRYVVEEYFQDLGDVPHGPPWLVASPYPGEDRERETYDLGKESPGLHRTFAELPLEQDAILEFANQWGRLTTSGLVLLREERADGCLSYRAESLQFWRFAIQEMRDALLLWDLLGGAVGLPDEEGLRQVIVWEDDSVWFRPAGEKLWFLYKQRARWSHEAVEAARRGDKQAAQAAERQMRHSGEQIVKYLRETGRAFLGMKPIASADSGPQAFPVWKAKRDVVSSARWLLSQFIDEHLKGKVNLVIEPSKAGRGFSTALESKDLLSAMWLELFFEVAGKTKLRQCPICGTWFDVTRFPRRIYCDRRGSGCRQKAARLRKELKELLATGKTLEEAAEELEMDLGKAEFLLSTGRT